MAEYIKQFSEISIQDLPLVGGKNASLGEMFSQLTPKGILVPDGFALTAEAYRFFLKENKLHQPLEALLKQLDKTNFSNLEAIGEQARKIIQNAPFPQVLAEAITTALQDLNTREKGNFTLAVRSSATAEDLPSVHSLKRSHQVANNRR